MEYILSMTFLTSTGAKSTMTVSGVKSTITKEEISALMDTIIEKNIFQTKSDILPSKSSANVTERKITKYELA